MMFRRRSMRGKKGDEAPFGMTSMIDVVFLLLIFFLLMPFKTMEGRIDLALPVDSGTDKPLTTETLPERIRIFIRASGSDTCTYRVNGRPLASIHQIEPLLMQTVSSLPDRTNVRVVVYPQGSVPFGTVLEVVDQCKSAQIDKIGFSALTI